jgi:hypothetical protein
MSRKDSCYCNSRVKKHTPEAIHSAHPKYSWSISSMGCLLPALEPNDTCGVEVANWFCITCAKLNGSHTDTNSNSHTMTQVYLSTIQVERRDASTSILIVSWLFRQYCRPLQRFGWKFLNNHCCCFKGFGVSIHNSR